MKRTMRTVRWRLKFWRPRIGSGWQLAYQLLRVNLLPIVALVLMGMVSASLFYAPPLFLQRVVLYLESDPERKDRSWGWFYIMDFERLGSVTKHHHFGGVAEQEVVQYRGTDDIIYVVPVQVSRAQHRLF